MKGARSEKVICIAKGLEWKGQIFPLLPSYMFANSYTTLIEQISKESCEFFGEVVNCFHTPHMCTQNGHPPHI